ncbi:MAG: sigma-70 family RNA polymerase sigma factor [Bryobacterales bacterium]|nr:sigma-70 family RNA polymerase sigma factor [Bryobacterales bacterium]
MVTEAVLEGQISSAPAVDETALIRAAQQGDQRAFEDLVRAYDRAVLRLAMNLLRSPEDAQDVYQEAFLRAYRNLPSFRLEASFQTWLYRIVTNLCLDHLRRRKVRREERFTTGSPEAPVNQVENLREERADVDPQRRLLSKELGGRIRQVLDGLTARERTVFELRHYHGLRLKDIGETLGTSEEAAKNCLFRVTQKMRLALGDFV